MFGIIFLIGILLTNSVLGEISYCCEKTEPNNEGTGGAWCVDANKNECDSNYLMEPTACISTSYCALGTCVNKRDGECMENTPQLKCDSEMGYWSESSSVNIPQCQLGCCAIGDQAAFVTQAKCKSFASLYSIDTHFQQNIQNEISCIASAFPDTKGACVFERELETTCKMITRSECQAISEAIFHEGFLCTADELATNCAETDKTTCVDGRDEVFFLDSCGNVANVYDSNMIDDSTGQVLRNGEEGKIYWTYITAPSCADGIGNAGSAICGDCGYFEGSTCKEYNRNEDAVSPIYGDFVCRDLGCEFDIGGDGNDETYLHGETWCASSEVAKGATFLEIINGEISEQSSSSDNTENNLPGSRFFRMVCYNGEVTIEPCADRKAEVCIQSEIRYTDENNIQKTFKSAVCRVNAWQDCVAQTEQLDCEDTTIRDCQWISEKMGDGEVLKKCVPLIAPGFKFWSDKESNEGNEEESAICSLASTSCTAHYEKSLADDLQRKGYKQIDGDECFDGDKDYISGWGDAQNTMCASLGDCQGKLSGDTDRKTINIIKNYLGFD